MVDHDPSALALDFLLPTKARFSGKTWTGVIIVTKMNINESFFQYKDVPFLTSISIQSIFLLFWILLAAPF